MKIKPINGWTKKSILTHIKANFKGKSVADGECVYRGSDGKKCAAGLFIPDSLYNKKMEGEKTSTVLKKYPKLIPYVPLEGSLMDRLQSAHDFSNPKNTLENILVWVRRNVA